MKKSKLRAMLNRKRRENAERKMRNLKTFLVTMSVTLFAFAVPVYAAGGNVLDPAKKIVDLLFSLLRIVGIGVAGYGFFELSTAIRGHDGAQKAQAIAGVISGLIIIFIPEILELIGVTF